MENTTNTPVRRGAKDFFLYAGVTIALYWTVGNFIDLVFNLVNTIFVDNLNNYYGAVAYAGEIRFNIASLIIIFPVYLILAWLVNKNLRTNPSSRDGGSRKVFTYLTIFLAGLIAVGDLVYILTSFLNGEVTTRFILKALVMLVTIGAVFAYYIYDLKRVDGSKTPKYSAIGAGVVILAVIVWSFSITGSPYTVRQQTFDSQRVNDLRSIQSSIDSYANATGNLPVNLDTLSKTSSYSYFTNADPETSAPYTYTIKTKTTYELCAKFDLASPELSQTVPALPGSQTNWLHEAGQKCFDLEVIIYPSAAKV